MVAATTEVKIVRRSRYFIDVNHGGDRFRIAYNLNWLVLAEDEDGISWRPADKQTGLTLNQRKMIAMKLVTGYEMLGGEWRRRFDLPAVC